MTSQSDSTSEGGQALLRLVDIARAGLDPVSLDVDAGSCCVIMGASGSGKTLLLRAIADLDPHRGEAYLSGTACSAMSGPRWRSQVTYVAAEPGWWDDRVAPHMARIDDATALAQQLDLPDDVMEAMVARLSTGERLRLALIRALIQKPRVLLLDEPTGALDEDATDKVAKLLMERRDAGLALLIVTHDRDIADRLADDLRLMRQGHLERSEP